MKNVVVVGSQWGDEGKGKIVDWLSSEADDNVQPVPWVFLVLYFLLLKTFIIFLVSKISFI